MKQPARQVETYIPQRLVPLIEFLQLLLLFLHPLDFQPFQEAHHLIHLPLDGRILSLHRARVVVLGEILEGEVERRGTFLRCEL